MSTGHDAGATVPLLPPPWTLATEAIRRAVALGLVFLPAVLLYAVAPLSKVTDATVLPPLADKARLLLAPFASYDAMLDAATAGVVALFLLFCTLTRRCLAGPGCGLAIAVLAVLFALAPDAAKGAQNIDMRFAIMLGLLLFAGLLPVRLPRGLRIAASASIAMLFLVRMALLCAAWLGSARDVADLRAAMVPVVPGSTVFVAVVSPRAAPQYWRTAPRWRRLADGERLEAQMPALLLIERHAFWPFLYDNESQQPIEQRPKYRALALQAGSMPEHRALATPGALNLCGFDYVLLLDAGGEPDLSQFAADRLELLTRTDFAALFRIRPQPRRCGGT